MVRLCCIYLLLLTALASCSQKEIKPRVFIFTDINIDSGDPDDRQSLVHLFWYADEVTIEGIVPDRWNARGYEACDLALQAYSKDYTKYNFGVKGYPEPTWLSKRIAIDTAAARSLFYEAAQDTGSPLYVLVWGNMRVFESLLSAKPSFAANIRLISIGTGLMLEKDLPYLPSDWPKSAPCVQLNWNGFGREKIYRNPAYKDMWWLEINWTYAGMFTGEEPKEMFDKLSRYGNLGQHIKEVVKNESWAQYFRVGDTPSLLYLLDRNHSFDDPTKASWAGRFTRPFPNEMPLYYTDDCGPHSWDYANTCNTWSNHVAVQEYATNTLTEQRGKMYAALLNKLDSIYK